MGSGLLAVVATAIALYGSGCATEYKPVTSGKLYRSGQLTAVEFEERVNGNIASVINLRTSGGEDLAWEKYFCKVWGIEFYHPKLSGRRAPTSKEIAYLIDVYRRSTAPRLVHCTDGRDRTGLAAAVYLLVIEGMSLEKAVDELSFLSHGHVPNAIDAYFEEFRKHLENDGSMNFEEWAVSRDGSLNPIILENKDDAVLASR